MEAGGVALTSCFSHEPKSVGGQSREEGVHLSPLKTKGQVSRSASALPLFCVKQLNGCNSYVP